MKKEASLVLQMFRYIVRSGFFLGEEDIAALPGGASFPGVSLGEGGAAVSASGEEEAAVVASEGASNAAVAPSQVSEVGAEQSPAEEK